MPKEKGKSIEAQVVKALDLVASVLGLRFESFWVQTILWDHALGEAAL